MSHLFRLSLIVCVLMAPLSAGANVTKKDLDVAARTFKFLSNKISGPVTAAVVYDPSNPQSKSAADGLKGLLGGGFKGGGATLTAELVEVGSLDKIGSAAVAFVTPGLEAHYGAIFAATSQKGLLSIGSEKTCVEAGKCVLSVESEPSVKIYVSKSAAAASSIEFQQAFRMMITEL